MKHLRSALRRLEIYLFPHEDGETFTVEGEGRAMAFLAKYDEEVFNDGFDAAVRAILTKSALRSVKFDHPKYVRDRRAAYLKARAGK